MQPNNDRSGAADRLPEHEMHEQRLAAALRDLVGQIDFSDYRDAMGHNLSNNLAFLKAQALVDEFGVSHEQICRTLADCDVSGGLHDAAMRLFAIRTAQPDDTPPEYRTWRTGP